MSFDHSTEVLLEIPLPEAVRSASPDVLLAAASDPALTEDLALVLLKQSDPPLTSSIASAETAAS